MTKSKQVKDKIKEFLSDGKLHNRNEIINYLNLNRIEYSESVLAGALRQLALKEVIIVPERGKYQLEQKKYINKDEFILKLSNLTEKYYHDINKEIAKLESTSKSKEDRINTEKIKILLHSYFDEIQPYIMTN